MQSRREFLMASGAVLSSPLIAGCSGGGMDKYADAAARLREVIGENPTQLEFVRFATLAANGHNTQPWKFDLAASSTSILPDLSRRTEVVDPDDHHLYVSLGCAAENYMLAAAAHGRPTEFAYDPDGDGRIDLRSEDGAEVRGDLYEAIPARQSTRSDYDGRKVTASDLRKLEAAAALEGVNTSLFVDDGDLEDILEFVVAGNSLQMDDPAFVKELKDWLRFNPGSALRTGDGLFSACSGNPVISTWFGNVMFGRFFKKDAENEKYAGQLRSSSGVAVFTGNIEDQAHWVQVGRSFQRFALQATALGIRHSHINQPVEAPSIRPEFASWLGAPDRRPDLVIRFGYAPPLPMSMRRPVSAVIA